MITLFCIHPKGFNIGNELIFVATQQFVREAFGCVVNLISLSATSRYETEAKAGLTARVIFEINQYGHGVIVGGGNLYENGELEVNLDSLKALDVPLMLFSLSMGRIYNARCQLVRRTDAMPANTVRALNEKASYSLARDTATFNYLHGIGAAGAQLGGCPTIHLAHFLGQLPTLPPPQRISSETVLISIRHPELMSIPLHKRAQVRGDIVGIIDFLQGEGFKDIRFLCHDHRDIPFAASFQGMRYIYPVDVYSFLSILQACGLNVSYRLHSVLPRLGFGKPVIPVSYDERTKSMIETLGLSEWDIDMIKSTQVPEEVKTRYRNLKELEALRENSQRQCQTLYSVISNTFRQFASDVLRYRDSNRPG